MSDAATAPEEGSHKRPRLRELDALRGLAAVSVVVYHYSKFMHELLGFPAPAALASSWLSWLYPFMAGEHGVALFFVISGFVIFMTLQRTERAMDFVVSRFARLFPAFWCGVTVTALVRIFVRGDGIGWPMYFANLTMIPEVFGYGFVDGVYWTLVVELQFYALMFLVWRLRLMSRIEWVAGAWLGLLGVSQVAAKIEALRPAAELTMTLLILRYIPMFAAGMMFHRIYTDRVTWLRVAIIGAAYGATWLSGNVLKAIVVTISFGCMALLVSGRLGRIGTRPVWLWLGDRSYAIYLVHMLIGLVLMQQVALHTNNPLLIVGLPALCTFSLAAAIHRFVEQPTLKSIRAWYAQPDRLLLEQRARVPKA